MPEDLLYYGDNLDILRNHIADDSVDLVCLDPHPPLSIPAIADLLVGDGIDMPPSPHVNVTFKAAPRVQ